MTAFGDAWFKTSRRAQDEVGRSRRRRSVPSAWTGAVPGKPRASASPGTGAVATGVAASVAPGSVATEAGGTTIRLLVAIGSSVSCRGALGRRRPPKRRRTVRRLRRSRRRVTRCRAPGARVPGRGDTSGGPRVRYTTQERTLVETANELQSQQDALKHGSSTCAPRSDVEGRARVGRHVRQLNDHSRRGSPRPDPADRDRDRHPAREDSARPARWQRSDYVSRDIRTSSRT
jgi:hypothetical protein